MERIIERAINPLDRDRPSHGRILAITPGLPTIHLSRNHYASAVAASACCAGLGSESASTITPMTPKRRTSVKSRWTPCFHASAVWIVITAAWAKHWHAAKVIRERCNDGFLAASSRKGPSAINQLRNIGSVSFFISKSHLECHRSVYSG